MYTGFYTVVTSLRTFQVEAAGIGDAIEKALILIVPHLEYLREVKA